jgi:hypothetical protein
MELRKTDNYYGACLATEPPLPFGLSGVNANNKHIFPYQTLSMNRSYTIATKSFCKLQYQISNIVYINSRYRGVDWLAVAGNMCLLFAFPPDNPNGKGDSVAKQAP